MKNIIYKGTGLEITDSVREYTEKKLDFIFRKYDVVNNTIQIEIGKTTNHHKNGEVYFAEAHFQVKKRDVYARAEKKDVYESLNTLQSEIYSQLSTNKEKVLSLMRKGSRKIKKILRIN